MKILICGAGRVGQGIARRLSADGHTITMIDEDQALVRQVTAELDVQGIVGHAAHPDVQRSGGAEDADMVIAVTHSDEVNILTCEIAHSLFDVQTKIARIRSSAYTEKDRNQLFPNGLHVDVIISPEVEVAESIFQRLETPGAFFSVPLADGKVRCIGVEIEEGTPLANTALRQIGELFPGLNARVLGISRKNKTFAASANDQLVPEDRVFLAIEAGQTERLTELLGLKAEADQRIVIIGAGSIGLNVARQLEQRKARRVRLIERDLQVAEAAAGKLKRAIVINGDGLNPEIMREAGVETADVVIGLTDQDNVNLLCSAMAKRLGAAKTFALVNSPDLSMIRDALDVDVLIDPRAVTISQILLQLRRGRILSLYSLENGAAEIAEGETLDHSMLLDSHLGEDDLPEGVVAGAVVRGDQILFPDRKMRVMPKDRIIMFYERDKTRKVENLFKANPAFIS